MIRPWPVCALVLALGVLIVFQQRQSAAVAVSELLVQPLPSSAPTIDDRAAATQADAAIAGPTDSDEALRASRQETNAAAATLAPTIALVSQPELAQQPVKHDRPDDDTVASVLPMHRTGSADASSSLSPPEQHAAASLPVAAAAASLDAAVLQTPRFARCTLSEYTDGEWRLGTWTGAEKSFCQVDRREDCRLANNTDDVSKGLVWVPRKPECALQSYHEAEKLKSCLQRKHLTFIGDSLSRNMQQSLQCMVMEAPEPPKPYVDGYKLVYNTELPHINSSIRIVMTTGVDKAAIKRVPASTTHLIVNTGPWWTYAAAKLFGTFKQASIKQTERWWAQNWTFPNGNAAPRAWVDSEIKRAVKDLIKIVPRRVRIIWRTPDISHRFRQQKDGAMFGCAPMAPEEVDAEDEAFDRVVRWVYKSVLKHTRGTRIEIFDVLHLSAQRPDAHPSEHIVSIVTEHGVRQVTDCLHWCLNGMGGSSVPDAWNTILLNHLCN